MPPRGQESAPFFSAPQPSEPLVQGKRLDGRGPAEFRNIHLRAGVVGKAQGSCYGELGTTKVMVGVYGPKQASRAQGYSERAALNCEVKYAAFATRTRAPAGLAEEEQDASLQLRRTLESALMLHLYPKTSIDVFVTVIESGGSDAALITAAASMAVAHAGIAMADLLPSCCVVRLGQQLLMDPTDVEEAACDGQMMVTMTARRGEVSQMVSRGEWPGDTSQAALQLAAEGCAALDELMRETLREALEA
ncbi:unnamed protein product [Pedinophyceae sp. YPF-701]|nr:unnamed protein product [Pedinophyceae sp. YPF-701]